jgi:hypothetical protein
MDGETIIAILIGAALACFSLVMVGYAFFRGDGSSSSLPTLSDINEEQELEAVGVGLDSIYDSIDTLDLEYHLGNMPEDQYREQLQAYRLEAAGIIKAQIDSGTAPPELSLELDIMALRAGPRQQEVFEVWRSCPQCDAPIPVSDAPCPHCGANIHPEEGRAAASSETAIQQ